MAESLNINLAGRTYTIRPLTIGQLEDLALGMMPTFTGTPIEIQQQEWQRNRELLAIALRQDQPEITAETVRDLPGATVQKVNETVLSVLEFAGLIRTGTQQDAAPGEAAAAA